jgi:hypothetical protein
MTRIIPVASAVSLALLAAVMVRYAHPDGSAGALLFVLAVYLLNAAPILGALGAARWRRTRRFAPLLLAFILAWIAYAGWAILDTLAAADAQAGLVWSRRWRCWRDGTGGAERTREHAEVRSQRRRCPCHSREIGSTVGVAHVCDETSARHEGRSYRSRAGGQPQREECRPAGAAA